MTEPMTLDEIRSHWEEAGRRFSGDEPVTPTSRDPFLADLERENVLAFLPSGCRMLEVGCGDGMHTIEYARACQSVTAVDVATSLIDKLKGRLRGGGIENVQCVVASVLDLAEELPLSSFDCAVSQRCLINLPDWDLQQQALRALHAALKPGGLLLLTEGFGEGLDALNEVRASVDLTTLDVVAYNHMLQRSDFEAAMAGLFETVEVRDYGTYLLLSRILHPLAVRPEEPKHDGRINAAALEMAKKAPIAGAEKYSYNLFYALRKWA